MTQTYTEKPTESVYAERYETTAHGEWRIVSDVTTAVSRL